MSGIKNAVSGIVEATVYYTKEGLRLDYLMIWDFIGRRSLLVRAYVVSMKDGSWLLHYMSQVWRLIV